MSLGKAIERLRLERRLTQNQLATLMGWDPSRVSKIERDAVPRISARALADIGKALDTSMDYLYSEAGWIPALYDPVELDLGERRLLRTIRGVPTSSLKQRVIEQLTWIAQVARDADLARQPALRLAADEREGYQAEEEP